MREQRARWLGLFTMLTSAAIAQQAPPAAFVQKVALNIPSQPVAAAIRELGQQTGLTIVIESTLGGDAIAPTLIGTYTAAEALKRILPKDLHAEYLDPKTAAVMAASSSTATASPPSPRRVASAVSASADVSEAATDATAGSEQPDSSVPSSGQNAGETSQKRGIEEVVVTGSHIRGSEAAGSKVLVITQDDIEKSGYARVQDVLATLTQNLPAVSESNPTVANNFAFGTGVELRGLGTGTTLTLVNGQRQAGGGNTGDFIDISSIPASAIARIEVLPDGASALYGSDAIGGVVNIILRKDFDGFETRVRGSTAAGDVANGLQLAQLWGTTWSSGHVLVGYQYDRRGALPGSARAYSAANNNYTPFGGTNYQTFYGIYGTNPGEIINPANGQPTAAIPKGQNGTNLTAGQLLPGAVNFADNVTVYDVLPSQRTQSVFLSASQKLADRWELSLDARYGLRDSKVTDPNVQTNVTVPAKNAFNHLGGPTVVAYDFTDDLGPGTLAGTTHTYAVSAGVTGDLPKEWQLRFTGNYAKEKNTYHDDYGVNSAALTTYLNDSDPATALNVFGDGSNTNPQTLAALRSTNLLQGVSTTSSVDAIVDGPAFNLPAGALRLALGADYREERQSSEGYVYASPPSSSRNVSAVFTELAIPVLDPHSNLGRLDISLAARYEDYSDVGSTLNPKAGLTWQPFTSVKIRGTWGTSFRAPPFSESPSYIKSYAQARTVTDPQSPTGRSLVIVESGVVPDLTPETAHVWTAGLDINPDPVKNLSLSFTYFHINYSEKIALPGAYTTFLTRPAIYGDLTTRNPSQEQISAVCNNPNITFNVGTCVGPFAAIIDDRTRNLSILMTQGLDADLNYFYPTPVGTWGIRLNGTYTFNYKTQLLGNAPVTNLVNTVDNPLKVRLGGHLSWELAGWLAQATANFSGKYADPNFTPSRNVDSWTTVDLTLGYRFDNNHGWLDKTKIYFSATNLFDKAPPFVNTVFEGYDPVNASLMGRQLSLQIIKGW